MWQVARAGRQRETWRQRDRDNKGIGSKMREKEIEKSGLETARGCKCWKQIVRTRQVEESRMKERIARKRGKRLEMGATERARRAATGWY